MIVHQIHDYTSGWPLKLLQTAFSKISNPAIIQNYHPDYSGAPGNFFTILRDGRYSLNQGTYYVLENCGDYISSAGWNSYPGYPCTALILSRMYVHPIWRARYTVGKYILPLAFSESVAKHSRLWVTINHHNKKFSRWFDNVGGTDKKIPELYKKFKFIGEREVYHVNQLVYEYKHGSAD